MIVRYILPWASIHYPSIIRDIELEYSLRSVHDVDSARSLSIGPRGANDAMANERSSLSYRADSYYT